MNYITKKTIFFIILVIVVIGGGYYLLNQPTSYKDNIPETKISTFYNKTYGYQLNYPEGTRINDSDEQIVTFDFSSIMNISESEKETIPSSFEIISSKESNPKSFSIRDLVRNNVIGGRQAPIPDVEKETTIDGTQAYYLEYPASDSASFRKGDYKTIFLYVLKNGNLYTIEAGKYADNSSGSIPKKAVNYSQIFNNAISSFHFTN